VEVFFEDGDSDVAAEEFRSCPVTAAVKNTPHVSSFHVIVILLQQMKQETHQEMR